MEADVTRVIPWIAACPVRAGIEKLTEPGLKNMCL